MSRDLPIALQPGQQEQSFFVGQDRDRNRDRDRDRTGQDRKRKTQGCQAGLECLTSSDPPALASQSAGITGMSHRTQPTVVFLKGDSECHSLAQNFSVALHLSQYKVQFS